MEHELQIQKTINIYSQAATLGDWDAATGTYLPDGEWSIPHLDLRFRGRDEIRGALTNFMGMMDYVIQMNAPAVITIERDTATARSGIREAGKLKDQDKAFEFLGFYVDRLVRTADGWLFEKRVFEGLGSHYFALSEASGH